MTEQETCPKCGAPLPANAPGGICPKCLMAAGLKSESEVHTGEPKSDPEAPTVDSPSPGDGFQPPPSEELADKFPQLEIVELLGYGGMGAVYKARQTNLDRLVALKIIRPEATQDPAFAERFNREAKMLARLSHQHIVGIYDFGEIEFSTPADAAVRPLYYFIMEFVDGVNLRQLMGAGDLAPEQALALVPQICDALQYAHDEGVVHRDIKPENILLDKRGRVKVADFGLAKLATRSDADFTLTGTNQVMGTLRYMAPEQMEGTHAVDHRADIYSLGVVFYEMLAGEAPMGHFEPPSSKVEIDVRLDEVVLRSLAREPERRYQQASQVKSEVESISSSPHLAQRPEPRRDTAAEEAQIEAARERVQWPTIVLFVFGVFSILMGALIAALVSKWIAVGFATFTVVVFLALVLMGVGGYSLWRLMHPEVREAFRQKTQRPAQTAEVRRDTRAYELEVETAREAVQWPAIWLLVFGVFSLLASVAIAMSVSWLLREAAVAPEPSATYLDLSPRPAEGQTGAPRTTYNVTPSDIFWAVLLAMCAIPFAIIIGAEKMLRLTSYRWAIAAAVLALSPIPAGPLWLLSLPLGIWALVVLSKPEVKRGFALREQRTVSGRSRINDADIEAARKQVQYPVIALLFLGIVTLPFAGRPLMEWYGDKALSDAPEQILYWLAFMLPPLATITGAVQMLKLASYRAAMAAGILVFLSPGLLEQREAWWLWWLSLLAGIWSLVVLSKPDVKRGFALRKRVGVRESASNEPVRTGRSRSGTSEPNPGQPPRSTLGQAWDAWWAERDRWITNSVQAMLALIFLVCLIAFLSFQYESKSLPNTGGRLSHQIVQFGAPDPWCYYESYPDERTPFQWKIDWTSWSTGIMLLGFLAWYANWQIEKAKAKSSGKRLRWWDGSPNFGIALWAVGTVAAVLIGLAMTQVMQ